MKKLFSLLIVFISIKCFGQVYQVLPQYGYEMKRVNATLVLLLPSDTTTNKTGVARIGTVLYSGNGTKWTPATATDTTSLSNRINLKLNISDTAAMLTPYAKTIVVNTKVNISDTAAMLSPYAKTSVVNSGLALKVNISDTATMLTPYLKKIDTASLSNRINLKANINSPTFTGTFTTAAGAIGNALLANGAVANLSGTNTGDQTTITGNAGTATALQTARTIGTTTGDATSAGSSFNGTANNTNALTLATVNSNVGTFTNSTITVNGKGLITAASSGTGVGTVTSVAALTLGTTGTDLSSTVANGTTTPVITLQVPTASATNRGALSSADWTAFNNKGSVSSIATDNTTGITGGTITTTGTLAIDTVVISTRKWRQKGIDSVQANLTTGLALKVNISDTSSMLSSYFRKVDTASLSNRINLKLNISDTSSMLSPYARTNSVNSGLALKVNISDTATMLSPYARKNFLNAGTGISYSSVTGTIGNTAPDQTVALTAGTGISTSGTYPNFTITNTSPSSGGTVTSVGLSSATSGVTIGATPVTTSGTITLAIATASGSQNGLLSSTDWTTFNGKQNAITLTTTGTSGAATLVGATLNVPQYADQFVGTVTSVAALTIGTTGTDLSSTVANSTTTPVITLNVPTASATNRGALSSADWTTFNNKAPALSGTTNYVPKFTGASTIGNSAFYDEGGFGGFNSTGLGSRTFVIQAATSRPLAIELVENANVHAVYVRPNNSGYNLISSNYISGGVYIPLALSGRESISDLVLWTNGNTSIGQTTDAGYKLDVNGTGRFSGNVVLSGSDSRFNGGDSVGRLILSNSNTTTYIGLYGPSYATTPYIMSFVVNSAAALTIASTGAATFSSSVTSGSWFRIASGASNLGYFIKASDWGDTGSNPSIATETGLGFNIYTNGTTIPRFTLASTGAATFSSSVKAYSATTLASLTQPAFMGTGEFMSTSTSAGYFMENRSGGVTSNTNWAGWYYSGTTIRMYNGSADIFSMVASTGAATFSSSVQATSFSNAGLQSGEVFNATKSNAGFYVGYLQNTSATGLGLYIQNGNDANDAIRIGNAAGSANNIQLYGSGKAYFAGNVGIGSSTIYNGGGFGNVLSLYNSGSFGISLVTSSKQYQVGISGTSFTVFDATSSVDRFVITTTGAATFSSSVTASQGNFNQTATSGFAINMTNRNNNQTWGLVVDADAVDDKILGFQSSYGFTPFYALKLDGASGAAIFSSSIKTAAPSGGTAKPFKIGAAATVTPTSQNRTIEIEIDGVTYYLTAKTTND